MKSEKSDTNETRWHIYLIRNKLDQLYAGITTDVERRFEEHNSNSPRCAKALKGKGPLKLAFTQQVENHSTALKAEIWLKKQSRKTKDKIITGEVQLPF